MYPTEWLILFPRWRYRRAGGDGCDCTVPPPRDRMAAVRVCLQKSHTVGGRPFHASALTITEDTACRYEVSAKQRSFHLQLLCWCMYFTHFSLYLIEPLEKLWQSLILARPAHCPGSLLGKESVSLHTPTLLLPLHPLHQVTGGSEEAMQFWGHTQSGCHHTLLTHRRPSHYTLSRLHDPGPRRRVR